VVATPLPGLGRVTLTVPIPRRPPAQLPPESYPTEADAALARWVVREHRRANANPWRCCRGADEARGCPRLARACRALALTGCVVVRW
jgi:hypothetical protein